MNLKYGVLSTGQVPSSKSQIGVETNSTRQYSISDYGRNCLSLVQLVSTADERRRLFQLVNRLVTPHTSSLRVLRTVLIVSTLRDGHLGMAHLRGKLAPQRDETSLSRQVNLGEDGFVLARNVAVVNICTVLKTGKEKVDLVETSRRRTAVIAPPFRMADPACRDSHS